MPVQPSPNSEKFCSKINSHCVALDLVKNNQPFPKQTFIFVPYISEDSGKSWQRTNSINDARYWVMLGMNCDASGEYCVAGGLYNDNGKHWLNSNQKQ